MKNCIIILLIGLFSCNRGTESSKDNRVLNSNSYIPIKSTKANEYFMLGENSLKRKEFEDALKYFYQSDKLEPNNVMILNSIANTECDIGNSNAGFFYFQRALLVDSLLLETYINYGNRLEMKKQYAKAISTLTQGLSQSNINQFEHYVLCFNLAISYYKNGNCDKAKHFIEIAIRHGTNNKEFDDFAQDVNEKIKNNCL